MSEVAWRQSFPEKLLTAEFAESPRDHEEVLSILCDVVAGFALEGLCPLR
jgi:hypothetical protein